MTVLKTKDFTVICDETNNTPEDRANRKINVDVILPANSPLAILLKNKGVPMTEVKTIPAHLLQYLSPTDDYQLADSSCGEIVATGHILIAPAGEEHFNELKTYGEMHFIEPGKYALLTKKMTRMEAVEKFGEVTAEEFGPRGGWKSVTFGEKKFTSKVFKRERS